MRRLRAEAHALCPNMASDVAQGPSSVFLRPDLPLECRRGGGLVRGVPTGRIDGLRGQTIRSRWIGEKALAALSAARKDIAKPEQDEVVCECRAQSQLC